MGFWPPLPSCGPLPTWLSTASATCTWRSGSGIESARSTRRELSRRLPGPANGDSEGMVARRSGPISTTPLPLRWMHPAKSMWLNGKDNGSGESKRPVSSRLSRVRVDGAMKGTAARLIEAPVSGPIGVAVDSGGTVYVAADDKIRRIDPSGIITTFAGTGNRGSDGDGGPAAHARLADPHGIAVDMVGNVFVAEWDGHRVRRIDGSGIITTFAGTGDRGSGGDGGPAIEAQFERPLGIAADTAGNIYVAEDHGQRLRRIDASGVITTYAGAGDKWDGDGGPAVEARVEPYGVAADTTGNVYLAEPWRGQVRKIDTTGIITTIAGTGNSATDLGRLDDPRAAAITASGDLFFGDSGSVWKLNVAGEVTRVAGDRVKDHPWLRVEDLAADSVGNLYVAENGNNLVRKVDSAGTVTTFAGTGEPGSGGDGGPATEARLDSAAGVAVDSVGNVYVVEGRGHRVRRINLAGVITTIAGTGNRGPGGDGGPATEAELEHPLAVAVGPAGNVYIADSWGWRIRKVDTSGVINEFADPESGFLKGRSRPMARDACMQAGSVRFGESMPTASSRSLPGPGRTGTAGTAARPSALGSPYLGLQWTDPAISGSLTGLAGESAYFAARTRSHRWTEALSRWP